MTLLMIIGVLFLAASAGLLARVLTFPRLKMTSQLRQIESYGYGGSDVAVQAPGGGSLRERLDVLAETFHGYRVMTTVAIPAFLLLVFAQSGSMSALRVLFMLLTAGLAWFGPALVVERRAQRRLDKIDRDLPELIDLLTATIEAGLGFAGSLQLVADRFHGPLGQELRLTLHEQGMGLSTEHALTNLVERCETPSVRAFARAVSQGETLGVSIGTMMRSLAKETRKRRRLIATEKVQRAPIKMLFPLVFCIFPALFIVLLFPALYRVVEQLGGG
jgi:tight adherence protein C